MEFRELGKTGFKVSVIGLGVEYLKKASVREASELFILALEEGVNYFDLVWTLPNIIEGLKEALAATKKQPVLAFHLGSCLQEGRYKRSRDPAQCEAYLTKLLDYLNLDSAPIINIHYVASMDIWKEVKRKGIVALAQKLKTEGTAQAVGVSTHEPEVIKLAVQSGLVDCVMHQVNVANHFYTSRDEALLLCQDKGVGVVAMKPLVGGDLLKAGRKVKVANYKTGWKSMTVKVPQNSNPLRLLNYTLSQHGVCTAVTGVSSLEELTANLQLFKAKEDEKDYRQLIECIKVAE
ncbi:MAG: aldo/keto reductase [Candidatus Bathyarchaeia archaeon]|jgi:predicted aldo/keto reductase-like oxidoreductase